MKHTLLSLVLRLSWPYLGRRSLQRYQEGLIDKTIVLIGNDVMFSDLENEVQMMSARGLTADRNAVARYLRRCLFPSFS